MRSGQLSVHTRARYSVVRRCSPGNARGQVEPERRRHSESCGLRARQRHGDLFLRQFGAQRAQLRLRLTPQLWNESRVLSLSLTDEVLRGEHKFGTFVRAWIEQEEPSLVERT